MEPDPKSVSVFGPIGTITKYSPKIMADLRPFGLPAPVYRVKVGAMFDNEAPVAKVLLDDG